MEDIRASLNGFKNHELSKAQLQDQFGQNLHSVKVKKPEVVDGQDVIFALEKYKVGSLTLDELLDWVNVIWFTDLFEYAEAQQDSIASVMSVLEELDEERKMLQNWQIDALVNAIKQNREYV